MGFFSWNCNECGHPLLSRYATNKINSWMRLVVAVKPDGTTIEGGYDGYGRVDGVEIHDDEYDSCCYHAACWQKAGKPTEYRVSASAECQGYFFGDEHDMPMPEGGAS